MGDTTPAYFESSLAKTYVAALDHSTEHRLLA
jgi:hypothetical protein